ncbi:hypothetical protein F5Y16DRAFT_404451 [Xylariaceae sp. FL0255]|nr:hypothetical protein F5Y16DRAFT_404451 [Xylariaceae sp. FL0255]
MHFNVVAAIIAFGVSVSAVAVTTPEQQQVAGHKREVENPEVYFNYAPYKKREVENPDVVFAYDPYKKRDSTYKKRPKAPKTEEPQDITIDISVDPTAVQTDLTVDISIPPDATQTDISLDISIPPTATNTGIDVQISVPPTATQTGVGVEITIPPNATASENISINMIPGATNMARHI